MNPKSIALRSRLEEIRSMRAEQVQADAERQALKLERALKDEPVPVLISLDETIGTLRRLGIEVY